MERLQNDSRWDRQDVVVALVVSVDGKGGDTCRGKKIMSVRCPFRLAKGIWCEGEKRKKKASVGALIAEERLFKYTESGWSLPRDYWLILKGAVSEVLFSTKPEK